MEDVYEVHNNSEDATAGRRRRKRRTKRAKDKKRAKSKRRPRRRRRTKRAAAQPAMYQHPQPTVYQHPSAIGASAYATNPLAPTAQPKAAARWDVKTGKDMNSAIDPDKEPEKPMTNKEYKVGLDKYKKLLEQQGVNIKLENEQANNALERRLTEALTPEGSRGDERSRPRVITGICQVQR